MEVSEILTLVLIFLIMIIAGLGVAYLYISYKNKIKTDEIKEDDTQNKKIKEKNSGAYTKASIYDFMQFDKIEDNMIIQDNGKKYLMVVECDGINYDLMSEMEKTAVEAGFVQFLNTLRTQIQLYIQSKTVNIKSSLNTYNSRLQTIKQELEQKENKYAQIIKLETRDAKEEKDLSFEIKRLRNLYEYGLDVVSTIEKVSQNKNVLRKHYYIIVPYYSEEIGNSDLLTEEEKHGIIFSELYTRAQSLIRALYACEVKCRVLTSTDIAELLYVAYNRDDSEIYSLETAIKAGYDDIYITAPDVLDKRMKALDEKIEKQALQLAQETIEQVKNEKQKAIEKKEESFEDLVRQMAEKLLEENQKFIGRDVAKKSIEKIKNTKEKGGKIDEKTRKTRKAQ